MTTPTLLLFVLPEASFGGVERQAELLAEAAHNAGHAVSLVVLGSDGPALARFREICQTVLTLRTSIRNDLRLHNDLRAAVKGARYDRAFLFGVAKFSVQSNALGHIVPRQVLHVGNPVTESVRERWKQQIRSWAFPPSRQLHLMANSVHTLRSLQRHPFYGRFSSAVSLNCVRIPLRPATLRTTCSPIRIGMVARLDPIKDHATLIQAVALLRRRGVSIECEFVGRGALENHLQRLSDHLGLLTSAAVKFLGWSAQVEEVLPRWDIFVFSTTAREGFGNAAAEAMAHGLPCVFTDVGPCREVGGDAVAYAPPGDAAALAELILSLSGDFAQRQSLGAAARERAKRLFQAGRKLDDFVAATSLPPIRQSREA